MINLTDENFDAEIKNAKKPVIVDFFATWCEPCSILGPILEKVSEELKDKVVLAKADVNEVQKTASKFEVDRIPMVILFDKGKVVDSFIGARTEKDIKQWLADNIKSKDAELINWSDEYAKNLEFKLNPETKTVERVVKGLLANEEKYGRKYCPCRRISGDKTADSKNICPCFYHRQELEKDGHCLCNLFVK